jgi:hypothetical protein
MDGLATKDIVMTIADTAVNGMAVNHRMSPAKKKNCLM